MDKPVRISLFLIPDYKFSLDVLDVSLLVPCSSLSLSFLPPGPSYQKLLCVTCLVVIISLVLWRRTPEDRRVLVAIAISVELETTFEGRRGGDRGDNGRFRGRKRKPRQTRHTMSEIYSPKANMIVTSRNRAQQDYRSMWGMRTRMEVVLWREVDYPPLRYLWKQTLVPDAIFCLPCTLQLRLAYDLRSNRARLPELDQETVEV